MGYAGLGAGAGALLLGPVGIAIGGALGSLIGYADSDEFMSLPEFIEKMNSTDKERLVKHMKKFLNDLDLNDFLLLQAVVNNPQSAKRAILLNGFCDFFPGKVAVGKN